MKIIGDIKPSYKYTIEVHPNKRGYFLIRFFENIKEHTETNSKGELRSGYTYDEYHLVLYGNGNIEEEVANNYAEFFKQAKAHEPVDEVADLKEEVNRLTEENTAMEEYIATLDEALIQMYEMMAEVA